MLATGGHAGLLATGYDDVVDETGQRRSAANEESRDCTPVGAELG